MNKIIYYIILVLYGLAIPLSGFAIINTMVSIKYETEDGNGCISCVSGENLCTIILLWKIVLITSIVLIMLLLICKRKIIKLPSAKSRRIYKSA